MQYNYDVSCCVTSFTEIYEILQVLFIKIMIFDFTWKGDISAIDSSFNIVNKNHSYPPFLSSVAFI